MLWTSCLTTAVRKAAAQVVYSSLHLLVPRVSETRSNREPYVINSKRGRTIPTQSQSSREACFSCGENPPGSSAGMFDPTDLMLQGFPPDSPRERVLLLHKIQWWELMLWYYLAAEICSFSATGGLISLGSDFGSVSSVCRFFMDKPYQWGAAIFPAKFWKQNFFISSFIGTQLTF